MKKHLAILMVLAMALSAMTGMVAVFAENVPTHPACPAPVANVTAVGTRVVGDPIDLTGISISTNSGTGSAGSMIDGNIATYWHSKYTAEGSTITSHDVAPFCVDVELPKKTSISGIGYIPRQNNTSGYWKSLQVLTSTDGKKYTAICNDTYEYAGADNSMKVTGFGRNVNAKYIRIIITESANYCMGAEFYVFGPLAAAAAKPVERTTTTADVTPGSGRIILTMNSTSASANGTSTTLTAAPTITGGATMVPFKYTVEALGGTYAESGEDINVSYNGHAYVLKKNSTYLTADTIRAFMAKPTMDLGGTTMASVLFFTNTLGIKAELNQAQQAIVLTK